MGQDQVSGSRLIQEPIQLGIHNKPITRQEYRNRQALLTKVNNFWVKGVLEKSLYNQVMIELGLEERPDAITNPWNVIIEMDDSSPQPLPDGTKIIDIFDQIGTGRTLLILGEPGSGKTTTLLELTRDLIARAEQDINRLIPVVFNLSSWANKRGTIADWLVEELNTKYDVPKKIGQAWVRKQQLLLLLDGLDEVKTEYRDDCIAALNQFKQEYGAELVVCSRIKDYEALSNRLNFQSAVYIRLLNLEQIYNYLDSVGADLTGLRALMTKDTILQELASSPLTLNIMTLAYQGVALKDLPKNEVLEERRNQLFNDYIERMFNRHNRSNTEYIYSNFNTKYWLISLAKIMTSNFQTILLIEMMQPNWLKINSQKLLYQSGVNLTIALVLIFTVELVVLLLEDSSLFLVSHFISLFFIIGFKEKNNLGNDIYDLKSGLSIQFIFYFVRNLFFPGNSYIFDFDFDLLFNIYFINPIKDISINSCINNLYEFYYPCFDVICIISSVFIFVFVCIINFLSILGLPTIIFIYMWYLITHKKSLNTAIQPLIKFKVSPKQLEKELKLALLGGMVIGLTVVFGLGEAINSIIIRTITGLISGLGGTLFFLLGFSFNGRLVGSQISMTTTPNQGIRQSAINMIASTLFIGSVGSLTVGILTGPLLWAALIIPSIMNVGMTNSETFLYWTLYNLRIVGGFMFLIFLCFGSIGGLIHGGITCIQHFILRLILYFNNYIPWNYARFLDYATERIFLQKVGGGYIFIHRMLMEHFAQMEIDER